MSKRDEIIYAIATYAVIVLVIVAFDRLVMS